MPGYTLHPKKLYLSVWKTKNGGRAELVLQLSARRMDIVSWNFESPSTGDHNHCVIRKVFLMGVWHLFYSHNQYFFRKL